MLTQDEQLTQDEKDSLYCFLQMMREMPAEELEAFLDLGTEMMRKDGVPEENIRTLFKPARERLFEELRVIYDEQDIVDVLEKMVGEGALERTGITDDGLQLYRNRPVQ